MVNTVKGSEIAELMLLGEYQNSPLLKQYIAAFVDELDILFEQLERVYLGRFIETAEGYQLDVIGIILNEFRDISLPIQFFGFSDNGTPPIDVAQLADASSPEEGGVFRSKGQEGTSNYLLSDSEYRRILLAKAYLSTKEECSVNNFYTVISTLLGRTPKSMQLVTIAERQVELILTQTGTTLSDVSLISYFSQYLIPVGTSFTITRI